MYILPATGGSKATHLRNNAKHIAPLQTPLLNQWLASTWFSTCAIRVRLHHLAQLLLPFLTNDQFRSSQPRPQHMWPHQVPLQPSEPLTLMESGPSCSQPIWPATISQLTPVGTANMRLATLRPVPFPSSFMTGAPDKAPIRSTTLTWRFLITRQSLKRSQHPKMKTTLLLSGTSSCYDQTLQTFQGSPPSQVGKPQVNQVRNPARPLT